MSEYAPLLLDLVPVIALGRPHPAPSNGDTPGFADVKDLMVSRRYIGIQAAAFAPSIVILTQRSPSNCNLSVSHSALMPNESIG